MKRIASFEVNHDILEKGLSTSRIDGDAITYDIRMKVPNKGDYFSTGGMDSIEHLFATYARNSSLSENVIYVEPMGCRTGFYLILRDTVDKASVLELVRDPMKIIYKFEGEMPGGKRQECGNNLDHNVAEAKAVAKDMLKVLENWKEEDFTYRT